MNQSQHEKATPPRDSAHTGNTTGNEAVDQVVSSLEQLEGAPVVEHVQVYETAHEKLRGALADGGTEQSAAQDDRPGD